MYYEHYLFRISCSEKEKEKIKKKLQANRKGGSAGGGTFAGSSGMLDRFTGTASSVITNHFKIY